MLALIKLGITILISDKIYFRLKNTTEGKKSDNFIKGTIPEEDVRIMNVNALIKDLQDTWYIPDDKLIELKGKF